MFATLLTLIGCAPQAIWQRPDYVENARIALPKGREVAALAWDRTGKALYYTTDSFADPGTPKLCFWPSGMAIDLPLDDDFFQPERIRISPDGRRLLVYRVYTQMVAVVDLKSRQVTKLPGACQDAWWEGSDVARIRPHLNKDGDWSERQYIQIGARKKDLPKTMSFSCCDESGRVLLAKSNKGSEGPIALYTLDPTTLRVKLLRWHRGPFYVELTRQDGLVWNPATKEAAISLTVDTGETLSGLWVSRGKVIWRVGGDDFTRVVRQPVWIGNRLAAGFNQSGWDSKERMFQIEELLLIDTRKQSHRALLRRRYSPWDLEDDIGWRGLWLASWSPGGTFMARVEVEKDVHTLIVSSRRDR